MNYKIIVLFIAYMVLVVSLGYFKPDGRQSKYLIRKSVHLITGVVIFYLTFHISRQALLILFVAGTFFSFITYFIKRFNYIHVTGDSSWGTLLYPVGILTSFLLLYEKPLYYFQVTLLFLAISDTVANIGGLLLRGNPSFTILGERKTPLGVIGFAVTALFISFALLPASETLTASYMILTVICVIHFEVISIKGSDNLAIPLGTALFFFLTYEQRFNAGWISALIVAMATISILLYKTNILTRKGTIGAHLLGIYFFGILGIEWGIPVALFFITSVIFTKIHGFNKKQKQDTGQRNVWQAIANIFAAIVVSNLFLVSGQPIFKLLFISAVAAVTADTWASEIGPVFHKKCFSLSEWRTATSGVSGGISIAGSLAAFSGAFFVSMMAWVVFFQEMDMFMVLIITLSGFLASFVDSLLGAFLEPRLNKMNYFLKKEGSESVSPNDIVNLLASATAPIIYLLLNYFIG